MNRPDPKAKREMMHRLREERKAKGLCQFVVWIKDDPEIRKRLKAYVAKYCS